MFGALPVGFCEAAEVWAVYVIPRTAREPLLGFADGVDLALLQAVYVIPRTVSEPVARLRRRSRLGSLAGSLRRAQDGAVEFRVLLLPDS